MRHDAGQLQALVSIHDVMPDTLPQVAQILAACRRLGLAPPSLLVVPGLDWQPDQLEQLRAWAASGHALAAHGWQHRARRIAGVRHRLHSALISRDAAEHLALSRQQIMALMRRAAHWFAQVDLPRPALYVPPAWALGDLRRADLARLPYQSIEVTQGFVDTRSGSLTRVPLVGYEADTRARSLALTVWNRGQIALAQRLQQPLRVGIHPHDLQLRLARDLLDLLRHIGHQTVARQRHCRQAA